MYNVQLKPGDMFGKKKNFIYQSIKVNLNTPKEK